MMARWKLVPEKVTSYNLVYKLTSHGVDPKEDNFFRVVYEDDFDTSDGRHVCRGEWGGLVQESVRFGKGQPWWLSEDSVVLGSSFIDECSVNGSFVKDSAVWSGSVVTNSRLVNADVSRSVISGSTLEGARTRVHACRITNSSVVSENQKVDKGLDTNYLFWSDLDRADIRARSVALGGEGVDTPVTVVQNSAISVDSLVIGDPAVVVDSSIKNDGGVVRLQRGSFIINSRLRGGSVEMTGDSSVVNCELFSRRFELANKSFVVGCKGGVTSTFYVLDDVISPSFVGIRTQRVYLNCSFTTAGYARPKEDEQVVVDGLSCRWDQLIPLDLKALQEAIAVRASWFSGG